MPLFVDFTTFLILGRNLSKFFVGILVQKMTPKGLFEIKWPLAAIMFIAKIMLIPLHKKRSNKLGHIDFRWLYETWLRPHLVTEKCNFYIPTVGRTTLVAFPNVSTFFNYSNAHCFHIVFIGLICGFFLTFLYEFEIPSVSK